LSAASAAAQQAAVDRTSTKIAVDRAALSREESLFAAGVAARKDVEAARAQLASDRADAAGNLAGVRSANAQAQSARDRAALAQRDLSNATLRAPSDGVVAAILKRPGEAVDPTTPVIAIAPPTESEVTLDVTSTDAARVHQGDRVELSIPGNGISWNGSVGGVASALDPTTQTASVLVKGVPSSVPAGAVVQATIEIGVDRGIVVPATAIVQDPESGNTLVFVETTDKNGGTTFAQRTVRIAHSDQQHALVASGLKAGERIAAQGAFSLLAPSGGGG
jgi:cobalt-zinc-cadmium efflux system membrane fusion protein